MENPKKLRAAAEIAATGNASHAARTAGVDRSTVQRWLKEAEFLRLIEEVDKPDPSPTATKALTDLVHKAVGVVEQGLEGEASVGAGRLALDVIKVAAQLEPKSVNTNETPPLADLLAQLDANKDA